MSARVAIVTGGAQGIGKGITLRLLAEGWQVTVADQDREACRQLAHQLGRETLVIPTDVARQSDVRICVNDTVEAFGRVDALINNAGVADPHLKRMDIAQWRKVLAIGLDGPFFCAKYALPFLRKTRGSIVNIASTRALMSEPHTEAYAATKGGLVAFTHALAISAGPAVRVNCVSPGWIDTSAWQKKPSRPAKLRAIDHAQHPVGRVGKPEDVAAMVAYLLSPQAEFVTGQNFIIDGGMTRKMIYAP